MKNTESNGGPLGALAALRQDAISWLAGWVNESTGQGDPERDKSRNVYWGAGAPLHPYVLGSLFTYNDLARAIVTALPEWGLRHGWELELGGRDAVAAQEVSDTVVSTMDDLGAHRAQLDAAVWGQLFGGGLLLLGAVDGRDTDEPLDIRHLRRIEWVRVVSRWTVWPVKYFDAPARAVHGQPELYDVLERFAGASTTGTVRYHASRVIRYPGPLTTAEEKLNRQGWDQSVLDYVVAKLSMSDSLWDDVATMVHDGSQGVWKIKGLFNAVLSGQRDKIEARFAIADKARSIFRSLLLDADGESFDYVHRQFTGVADLLGQSAIRTAAAAQIPVTVLFGQSPQGLNATGEGDIRLWYDRVEQYQSDVLRPGTETLVRLLLRSKEGPTGGEEPANWTVAYRNVRKLTPMEQAEVEARKAQADASNIKAGIYSPEEAAVSRYTPRGWSGKTQINLAWRQQVLKRASELLDPETVERFARRLFERLMAGEGDPAMLALGTGEASPLGPANPQAIEPTAAPAAAPGAPAKTAAPPVAPAVDLQAAALNGAQITSLLDIGSKVRTGEITKEWAVFVATKASPLITENDVLGALKTTTPASAAAPEPKLDAGDVGRRVAVIRTDARDGVMVAIMLPSNVAARLALQGGEPMESLHITLAYFGRASDLDAQEISTIDRAVRSVARQSAPLTGQVGGIGRFAASPTSQGLDVVYAPVDVPGLGAFRAALAAELERSSVPARAEHDFTPHVTLAYVAPDAPLPVQSIPPLPLEVAELELVVAGERRRFPFMRGEG